ARRADHAEVREEFLRRVQVGRPQPSVCEVLHLDQGHVHAPFNELRRGRRSGKIESGRGRSGSSSWCCRLIQAVWRPRNAAVGRSTIIDWKTWSTCGPGGRPRREDAAAKVPRTGL